MARQAQAEPISRAAASWYTPGDSPAKCRQRRRRRIEMRRERPSWPPAAALSADEVDLSPRPPPRRLYRNPMPVFSSISINVDGAVWAEEDFCRPAADLFSGGEPLHFFAVCLGHAASVYKKLFHRIIAEELALVAVGPSDDGESISAAAPQSREWWNDRLLSALQRGFKRMDRVATEATSYCAAAAMVAVLTAEHIVVARGGGTSRAVLCSDGIPIPLSNDHPQNNEPRQPGLSGFLGNNELRSASRISEAEIFIIERSKEEDECLILASNGVWDVTSDVIASDVATTCLRDGYSDDPTFGPNEDHHCFNNALFDQHRDHDQLFSSYSDGVDAAALLCRLALGRGSSGSISIIVVDFKEHY